MIETGIAANPLMQQDVQSVQKLPAPPGQDVARFESILNTGSLNTDSADASLRDVPVLQNKMSPAHASGDSQSNLLGKVAEIDESYKNMLSQFTNMPKFTEYVAKAEAGAKSDAMRSYPDVSMKDGQQGVFQAQVEKIQAHMTATTEYQGMFSHWNINAQMFLSKINIVSAAVRHVSEGFKTLFRAAG